MSQVNPMSDKKSAQRRSALDAIRHQKLDVRVYLVKRSWHVTLLKRVLPGIAVILLIVLAVAPSWRFGTDAKRVTYHLSPTNNGETSSMEGATYHGHDQQGQPYVVTASQVVQKAEGAALLTSPQGSLTLKSGAWLMLKSKSGVYDRKTALLDLSNDVTLYRNDGIVMTTSHATIDLHTNSAAGTVPVNVSGPFGTLSAQKGFTLTDHGDHITFLGPATLVLNQAQ